MKSESIDYAKLMEAAEKTVSAPSFYWQSLSVITCLVLSYLVCLAITSVVFPKISKGTKRIFDHDSLITKYIIPTLFPLLSLAFLFVGILIYSLFFDEVILFTTTIKLVTLLLFLRFLRISSNSNFVANAVGIFLMPAIILNILGLSDIAIFYLDQYAIKIGSIRLSFYVVLKAFTVVLTLLWLANLITKNSKIYINKSRSIKSNTKNIIGKFIDIFAYTITALVILKTLGVDMTAFAVIGGAIGVGIGFGLQKIASNFISGIILLFEQSIEIGDWVELEKEAIFGVVKHFGGRYTLIECFDGKEVMVPNEDFIIGKVTNWTYSNNRARAEIIIGIERESEVEEAIRIMTNCARSHIKCLNYPETECYLLSVGEYDIKLTLRFWINDITQGITAAKSDVTIDILNKLREAKIKISFPRREISIFSRERSSI